MRVADMNINTTYNIVDKDKNLIIATYFDRYDAEYNLKQLRIRDEIGYIIEVITHSNGIVQ